ESVFARCLSAQKEERVAASKIFTRNRPSFTGDRKAFIAALKDALLAAKIVSYAQGFALMQAAAEEYGWDLHYGEIALMWRGGCIIRSAFLGKIKDAFDADPKLKNLMISPFFKNKLEAGEKGWRMVISTAALSGIPVPTLGAALSYFDGYQTESLPANLLQAQRDYFGAHSYQRIDDPSGTYHHTNWTGRGGDTASTTYTV
ncbi:MAG TPA: NADP-dependent phosphogluconate dehydrogenase, partial [Treponemataceae bacterium]|nr:NADP-dependent phosphogluconate dehydrogenase [Treponemataceae bacterium]